MPDIKLPNGKIIRGVPEGTSKEDVMNKAISSGLATSEDFGVQTQQPSFGDQALGALENVGALASSIAAEPVAGLAGIGALLPGGQTPTEAIESTREALTFKPRTETGQEQQQAIGETLAPISESLSSAEKFLGKETLNLTGSPALAAAAHSLPTAALELLGVKGTKAVSAPRAARSASKRQVKKAIIESAPEVRQLKDVSRQVYKEIDNSGVRIKPGSFNGLVRNIESATKKAGLDSRVTPRAAGALDVLKDSLGKTNSLSEVDTLRKVSQNVAKNLDPTESALGNVIISEIDDYLDNLKPIDLTKGAEDAASVGKKFKSARKLWGRARRSELIQEAIERGAKRASGAENGIRVELDKITRNKKLKKFFPKNELAAIDDVVKGNFSQNMSKLIGRFGFSEGRATNVLSALSGVGAGGVLGGGIGAFAVPAAGTLSRQIAQKLTRGRSRFIDTMTRAGNDAEKITKAYLTAVPKAKRSVQDLSDLLSDPNVDLSALEGFANETVLKAKEIAEGRKAINLAGGAAAGTIPSILEEE